MYSTGGPVSFTYQFFVEYLLCAKATSQMLNLQNKAELVPGVLELTVQTWLMMEGPTVCFGQTA